MWWSNKANKVFSSYCIMVFIVDMPCTPLGSILNIQLLYNWLFILRYNKQLWYWGQTSYKLISFLSLNNSVCLVFFAVLYGYRHFYINNIIIFWIISPSLLLQRSLIFPFNPLEHCNHQKSKKYINKVTLWPINLLNYYCILKLSREPLKRPLIKKSNSLILWLNK